MRPRLGAELIMEIQVFSFVETLNKNGNLLMYLKYTLADKKINLAAFTLRIVYLKSVLLKNVPKVFKPSLTHPITLMAFVLRYIQ
jgi:hypothetical protein